MTLVVQLMGTVRVLRDGQPVDVGGPKPRAVLAVLALSAGRRVSTDRLVDLVWDENPPASARRTLQSYVASLRRALGAGAALEPSQNGYTLNLERGQVDLLAFEDTAADLLADTAPDPDDKAQGLADVLSTWEAPLDGLRGSLRLDELTAPFEELRLQAVEGLAAAQIAGIRAGDAVKTLEALVREYPTRENLWLELARGLNRLGRRDAALNAIQRAREALREHLGVHPSALLSALETDLLAGHAAPCADGNGDGDGDGDGSVEPGSGTDRALLEPERRPGNLPKPLSSFIGREAEIDEIAQLLAGSRLVTLRGLGGIGKTSLALRVAADHAATFDDGAWFIDLAYVAPAAEISERFIAALELRSQAEASPVDQLLAYLAPLRALLVVDNCERQIEEIAELVAKIVHVAPDLHVLATSRTSLTVAGEAVWPVRPLEVSTAVELFAERARLVRRDFELNDATRSVVELICEKLDGIPLAIELAAARLNVLGLDQILENLDDRFGLLRGHTPAARDEERTLQAALDWSYELLDEHDRTLLRRLTVFPAEFTLEAAKDICAADSSTVDLVNSMALLVEASLIVFDANDDDPRYGLLETVHEYTVEMRSASERNEVALQHATYYLDVASRIAGRHETDHVGALRAGDRDLDNFRAAMAYAFTHEEPELGLAIARHLRMYFLSRQLNGEYLRWLQAGLEQAEPESDEALRAVSAALVAAVNSEDVEVADRLAERVQDSIDLARNAGDRATLLCSYAAHLTDIDPRAADDLLAEATDLVKRNDTVGTLACIHNRLMIAWLTGDLSHSAAMFTDLDDLPDGPYVRLQRVIVEIQAAACAGRWEEVIDVSLEHYGLDEETSVDMLSFRAEAFGALGRIDDAIATLDQLDELERRENLARSGSQTTRASSELRRGDAAKAKSLLAESAAAYSRESDRVQGLWIASLAGAAAHQLDNDETAALLFGYARTIAEEFDINLRMSQRPLTEHAAQQCRATLGPDRFDELARLGSSSSWSNLVELIQTA